MCNLVISKEANSLGVGYGEAKTETGNKITDFELPAVHFSASNEEQTVSNSPRSHLPYGSNGQYVSVSVA